MELVQCYTENYKCKFHQDLFEIEAEAYLSIFNMVIVL